MGQLRYKNKVTGLAAKEYCETVRREGMLSQLETSEEQRWFQCPQDKDAKVKKEKLLRTS